jgi:hypothetical protein
LPALLVLEEETQIKVPISVIAMQKRGWCNGVSNGVPHDKELLFFEGCVVIGLFQEGQGFVVAGDEVCTPMDHILDWFSGLAIANPSFGFVRKNSDQSRALIGPGRCSA